MRSRRGLGHETGRPWHHHRTQGAHCFTIQAGCPRTQCGLGRVRGLLHCSGSSRRCCTGGIRSQAGALQEFNRETTEHSLPPACVDCGRAATPSRRSDASVRCRHSLPAGMGQHLPAKSLHRRWKHEIQIALLRRRAVTARAVLPNPSARVGWLFTGIIDRASHHWGHVPALDGPGVHDQNFDGSDIDSTTR